MNHNSQQFTGLEALTHLPLEEAPLRVWHEGEVPATGRAQGCDAVRGPVGVARVRRSGLVALP